MTFPFALVRLPAIARSRLKQYRYASALELNRRARVLREELWRETEPLIAALFALTPRMSSNSRRGALAAQRALHNVRELPGGEWLYEIGAADPKTAAALRGWDARQRESIALLEERDREASAEQSRRDAALLALCRDPCFEKGLTLANPGLAAHVACLTPGAALSKSGRRTLASALQYVLRASMKPTPLGYFCSTAAVPLHEGHDYNPEKCAMLQVNRAALAPIFNQLLEHPAVRAKAMIRLSAQAYEDNEGFWIAPHGADYHACDSQVYRSSTLLEQGLRWSECKIEDAQIIEALISGAAELDWGLSNSEADDFDVLLRLLWEAAFCDFDLLPLIADVTGKRDAVQHRDVRVVKAAEPLLFEDTYCRAVPLPRIQPFLDELGHYAGDFQWAHVTPEEQVLAEMFRRFNPGAEEAPLLKFHRQYAAYCAQWKLGTDHWSNTPHLCQHFAVKTADPMPQMAARLTEAVASCHGGELAFPCDARELGTWKKARRRRLSLRLAGAPGGRFHPVFWGGEAMSLLPRYARNPFAADFASSAREWFARWPEQADIYGSLGRSVDLREPFTRRLIQAPGVRPEERTLQLRGLRVRLDADGAGLVLTTANGERVQPLFLGVTVPDRLPAIHQFLFHLGGRRANFFEFALRSVGQFTIEKLTNAGTKIERLPLISLGSHIVLSGPAYIVPCAALPLKSIGYAELFRFQDWLDANRLPHLAQAWAYGQAPLWVDLDHPFGIKNLLRLTRSANTFLLRPPLLGESDLLQTPDGAFETEYYVEFFMH